jgi:hypothetical protein
VALATAVNGAIAGGIAGGVAGAITTGSLQGALLGAAQGAAFAGLAPYAGGALGSTLGSTLGAPVAGRFIATGLVGGLFSVAQGSNFGSGFLDAGVGSLAGPLTSGGGFTAQGAIALTDILYHRDRELIACWSAMDIWTGLNESLRCC